MRMNKKKHKAIYAVLCVLIMTITAIGRFVYINRSNNATHNSKSTAEDDVRMSGEYGYTTTGSRLKISQLEQTVKNYSSFISTIEKGLKFNIPGLENTFIGKDCSSMVPQGICIAEDYFITTAYDASGENGSVLYLTNATTKLLECVIELPLKIHAGGIAFDGEKLWICADDEYRDSSNLGIIYSIAFEKIKQLNNQDNLYAFVDLVDMEKSYINNSASFCTYFNNRLWVGTFTKHSNKDSTFGCMMSYDVNDFEELEGAKQLKHESFLVLPNRSQGVCFFEMQGNTYMALSRSYTRSKHYGKSAYISEMRVYLPLFDPDNSAKILKKGIALAKIETPPMIEEICYNDLDGMLYAIFESGASKYSTDNTQSFMRCKYIFDKIAAINPEKIIKSEN